MTNTYCTELLNTWEEMICNARGVANAEAEFNQELFCNIIRRTWQVFRDEINFDVIIDEYALNTNLLKLLMKVDAYSKLTQVSTEEGVDIGMSAFLAKLLRDAILYRKMFSRDEPVIKGQYDNNYEHYNLCFDLDRKVLVISDTRGEPPVLRFDRKLLEIVTVPQPMFEPFEVTDLSKFWFDDVILKDKQ